MVILPTRVSLLEVLRRNFLGTSLVKRAVSRTTLHQTQKPAGIIATLHQMQTFRMRRPRTLCVRAMVAFAILPSYVNPALIPLARIAAMRYPVWSDVLKNDNFVPHQDMSPITSSSEIPHVRENLSDCRWQPPSSLAADGVGYAKSAINRARTAVDVLSTSFLGPAWCAPITHPHQSSAPCPAFATGDAILTVGCRGKQALSAFLRPLQTASSPPSRLWRAPHHALSRCGDALRTRLRCAGRPPDAADDDAAGARILIIYNSNSNYNSIVT